MKTIVISDSHLRHPQIETILGWEEPYDRAVWLGDFFDPRGFSGTTTNLAAARWLKQAVHNPRWSMLTGNHDWASIRFPDNPHVYGTDWATDTECELATAMLTEADWAKLRLYDTESGILLSHAGLDVGLFNVVAQSSCPMPNHTLSTLPTITAWLDSLWPGVIAAHHAGDRHPLVDAGRDRGGYSPVGGMIWRDFSYHSPIDGLGQIVGHTIQEEPLFRIINRNGAPMWRAASKGVKTEWLKEGWTLGLDTRSHHYVVLQDGHLIVKAVTWIRNSREDNSYRVEPGPTIAEVALPDSA